MPNQRPVFVIKTVLTLFSFSSTRWALVKSATQAPSVRLRQRTSLFLLQVLASIQILNLEGPGSYRSFYKNQSQDLKYSCICIFFFMILYKKSKGNLKTQNIRLLTVTLSQMQLSKPRVRKLY